MKKICKFLILSFIAFGFVNVNAAGATCNSQDYSKLDPTETSSGAGNPDSITYYDISYVGIDRDHNRFFLTGWVFKPNVTQEIGQGKATVSIRLKNTKNGAEHVFEEKDIVYANRSNTSDFKDYYNPKYYDLTYWFCKRDGSNKCISPATLTGGFSASIDLNDIDLGDMNKNSYVIQMHYGLDRAGKWITLKAGKTRFGNDSNNKWLNPKNLVSLSGKATQVKVKNSTTSILGKSGLICDSIISEYTTLIPEGHPNRDWIHPDKATLKPISYKIAGDSVGCRGGDSRCNRSNNSGLGSIQMYQINEIQSGPGPSNSTIIYPNDVTNRWKSSGIWNGFYGLNAEGKLAFPGGQPAYLPRMWVNLEGDNLLLTVQKNDDYYDPNSNNGNNPAGGTNNKPGSGETIYTDPNLRPNIPRTKNLFTKTGSCSAGKTEVSLYYLFSEGITTDMLNPIKEATVNVGINFSSEQTVFEKLGLDINNIETIGSGVVQVVPDGTAKQENNISLRDYYLKTYVDKSVGAVIEQRDNNDKLQYYFRGGGYFKTSSTVPGKGTLYVNGKPGHCIASWQEVVNGYCDHHWTEPEEKDNNSNSNSNGDNKPRISEYFRREKMNAYNDFQNFAVSPATPDDINIELLVPEGNKFNPEKRMLRITRNYRGKNPKYIGNAWVVGKSSLSDATINDITTYRSQSRWGDYTITFLQPAVYRWDICADISECSPKIDGAKCKTGDEEEQGTIGSYHEDDRLQTCTLSSLQNSGFMIHDTQETSSYCKVACKDDIDIEAPTHKSAAAGTYFTLNNYSPKVTGTRTCATSEIDYDKFDSDLTNYGDLMVNAYNEYRDYLSRYNTVLANAPIDHPSDVTCPDLSECPTSCDDIEDEAEKDECETKLSNCNNPQTRTIHTYTFDIPFQTPKSDSLKGSGLFYGRSGEYGESYNCDGNSVDITTWGDYNAYESYKNEVRNRLATAENKYNDAKLNYRNAVNDFAKCFSWTDNAPMMSDNFNVSMSGGKTYPYGFSPNVTFEYDDEDAKNAFGGKSVNLYGSLDTNTLNTYYWNSGDMPDGTDNLGSQASKNQTGGDGPWVSQREYIRCTGDSCTTFSGVTYKDTKFIKRVEQREWNYSLPTVYTKIPSGIVTRSTNGAHKELERNAVPVNINTLEGNYDYTIKVSGVEDNVRKEAHQAKSKGESLTKMFEASNVFAGNNSTTGEGYKCDYDVINDIYDPGDPNDPNSQGKTKFFYRPVDTLDINHPDSANNPLGYNWNREDNGRAGVVIDQLKSDAENYQELTDEEHGKFTFRLTPTVMKQIRYYNAERSRDREAFADFNLSCEDTNSGKSYHCYSPFLSCLASRGTQDRGKNGTAVQSCYEIFGTVLNNYKDTFNELQTARDKLINKQIGYDALLEGGGS